MGIIKITIMFVAMLLVSAPLIVADDLADKLAKAIDLYSDLEFDAGLEITDELLQNDALTASDSIAVLEVKSIITYAKGESYKQKSFTYLQTISEIGHCLIRLPREIWPSELRDKWYSISNKKKMMICPEEAKQEIQTIAIMEFDNFSIGKYQEELGSLSKGLADFFEYDFGRFSTLKVVEREKIDYILREIELVEAGKIDKATAARVGKLLGAQLMVFGSITQIDKKNARMVVRVVNVETSEIIRSASREGKPDFVNMEKELVKDLAEQLDIMLTKETEIMINESGPENMDAARLYSLGLEYMDKYDYNKAYDYFKKAYAKDNSFVEAKQKMEIYKPLIG